MAQEVKAVRNNFILFNKKLTSLIGFIVLHFNHHTHLHQCIITLNSNYRTDLVIEQKNSFDEQQWWPPEKRKKRTIESTPHVMNHKNPTMDSCTRCTQKETSNIMSSSHSFCNIFVCIALRF